MTLDKEALNYLIRPRERWVEIEVAVHFDKERNAVGVSSRHTSKQGELLQAFSIHWPEPSELNTEYGYGLSLIHDVKDHYFYGLGITTLTEFQTIVQTYYGREASGGQWGRADNGDYVSRIEGAIQDELFGPRGPRVYGPLQTGLLDLHAADAGAPERLLAYQHMRLICLDIMLPILKRIYDQHPLIRRLQASTRDQPQLVESLLQGVRWSQRDACLLKISDNIGLRIRRRAYVDEMLSSASRDIRDRIREYVSQQPLLPAFGPIFDTTGYALD